jgi:hypothetical protein
MNGANDPLVRPPTRAKIEIVAIEPAARRLPNTPFPVHDVVELQLTDVKRSTPLMSRKRVAFGAVLKPLPVIVHVPGEFEPTPP